MKARDWLNQNSALVTIGAVLVLIAALVYIVITLKPIGTPKPVDVYYYDLGSTETDHMKRLFTGKSNEFPPIDAPSGQTIQGQPAGARAWVWSCGECSDASKRFIGYLELFTPRAKEMMLNPPRIEEVGPPTDGQPGQGPTPGAGGPPMIGIEEMRIRDEGHRIASPDNLDNWVPYTSAEGSQIIQDVQSKCGEGIRPKPCYPADE